METVALFSLFSRDEQKKGRKYFKNTTPRGLGVGRVYFFHPEKQSKRNSCETTGLFQMKNCTRKIKDRVAIPRRIRREMILPSTIARNTLCPRVPVRHETVRRRFRCYFCSLLEEMSFSFKILSRRKSFLHPTRKYFVIHTRNLITYPTSSENCLKYFTHGFVQFLISKFR